MREEKEVVRASAARVCRVSCRDGDPDLHTRTLQDAEGDRTSHHARPSTAKRMHCLHHIKDWRAEVGVVSYLKIINGH